MAEEHRPDETAKLGKRATAEEYVRQALHGLLFGEIRLVVQDGVVVQVERTERRRVVRAARRG